MGKRSLERFDIDASEVEDLKTVHQCKNAIDVITAEILSCSEQIHFIREDIDEDKEYGFDVDDTPLHSAIRARGSFRRVLAKVKCRKRDLEAIERKESINRAREDKEISLEKQRLRIEHSNSRNTKFTEEIKKHIPKELYMKVWNVVDELEG